MDGFDETCGYPTVLIGGGDAKREELDAGDDAGEVVEEGGDERDRDAGGCYCEIAEAVRGDEEMEKEGL